MDDNLPGLEVTSYLGGMTSMLAATFIVFSALSMGVSERQRTLAMLRAVGAYRWQVAELVVIEGLVLAVASVVIGVPLGWAWIKGLSLVPQFEAFFSAGVVLSTGGVLLGALGSIGAGEPPEERLEHAPRPRRRAEAEHAAPANGAVKLFVNRGRRSGIGEDDLRWALNEGAVIPDDAIEAIRVLERFSFVELDAEHAERAVERLDGTKLKGRQLRVELARG